MTREEAIKQLQFIREHMVPISSNYFDAFDMAAEALKQPEIVRCKDCKFYSPMNRETKTGICNLTLHQNFGDDWFCAGAERRTDGKDRSD